MIIEEGKGKVLIWLMAGFTALSFLGGIVAVIIVVVIGGGSVTQTADVISLAQKQTVSTPRDPDAWSALASAYLSNDKAARAVAPARRALDLAPDNPQVLQTYVVALSQAGQKTEALASAESYAKDHPTQGDPLLLAGQLAEEQGLAERAILAYEAYLRLEPKGSLSAQVKARIKELRSTTASTP